MKLRVLGCSGGIGGNLHTTSFLLDHDVLIDAGTGVNELSLTELSLVDHVFITHSHLDHIACIPLLVDSVGFMRDKPLTVYATEGTLDILKQHVFNWKIWPDFSEIPSAQHPFMRYQAIELGETIVLDGRSITAVPATHVVPAVGYWLDSGRASLVYSGDTTSNDAFWEVVNKIENLRYLIIETAFSDSERELAILSKHLCPSLLAEELQKFQGEADVFVTHLKPGEVELTMREIESVVRGRRPRMLLNNQEFEF
ncbi:cAMP phosphodiesterase class-II:metallo-beta-lactamase superfamily protein [Ferrigenium kumadai]|uniref:cAMP phosphodiesterase class-II:metallo-beta-lactamase superfamily protein n=1 Tax=Ferrigenium kumadai TaxID=1682490 RepID=A0AAN1W0U7_9PROT|nr:3',5'-cyclic-nucleotide phosphodiesterase [Ferrigenium kumadai]BBJ00042.1 cAMP phosphodiesterase class-II:metallo-beta-lactamase superfamily protein [Ferrigenium kumadai]